MTCHLAAFTQATCRIEVERRPSDDLLEYTARMAVVDQQHHVVQPVTDEQGRALEIHATSESLAFNSAVTYLERRFGGFSEIVLPCDAPASPPTA